MLRKLYVLSLFLFSSPVIYACSCAADPPVLDEFEWAKDVFTAKVVSRIRPKSGEWSYEGITGIRAVVQKVYKGDLKPGERVFFKQGNGVNCTEVYEKDIVGTELLAYDHLDKDRKGVLSFCGRPMYAAAAREDFLYLDNLDKVAGKTRVSGRFGWSVWKKAEPLDPAFKGVKIKLTGEAGTFETTVDDYGIYEMYDIPPGTYRMTYTAPLGYELDPYQNFDNDDAITAEMYEKGWPLPSLPITVKPGRQSHLDLIMRDYNPVRIRVLGPDGQPMNDVGIDAWPKRETSRWHSDAGGTGEKGEARLTDFPSGSYFLRINGDGKITASQPYPVLFYPGTTDPGKAEKVTIPVGGLKEPLTFRVSEIYATNYLEGTVVYADGSPAKHERIDFVPVSKRTGFDDTARQSTDDQGRFRIRVFHGLKGKLKVDESVYESEFKGCSDTFKQLQREFGGKERSFNVRLSSTDLHVTSDIKNITLKLPYTPCPEKK